MTYSEGGERLSKKKVPATVRERAALVESGHPKLTIKEQCELLEISRSAYYYKEGQAEDEREIAILTAVLEVYNEKPFYGYRKVAHELHDLGVTRKQIRRIMRRSGLRAIYPGKRTSIPAKYHKKYP